MNNYTKLLLTPFFAGALLVPGCGGETSPGETEQHAQDDGHGHGDLVEHPQADGHDDHAGESTDAHGSDHGLGEVEIAGVVLGVRLGGELAPNATLHLDLELKSGPTPAAIRVWVGDQSASGSIKGKASGSGGDYHADAVCPAELKPDAALWVEVESADGTRSAGAVPAR